MLKGKKSIYVLLPVNLLVWGFIGWKIFAAFQGEDVPAPSDLPTAVHVLNKEDTVQQTLALNYPDPFLKQEPQRKNRSTANSAVAVQSQPMVQKPVKVPAEEKPTRNIVFLGSIQNKSSGKMMAMVSLNGATHTLKKGDQLDGMTVKEIGSSFIELKEGKKIFRVSAL